MTAAMVATFAERSEAVLPFVVHALPTNQLQAGIDSVATVVAVDAAISIWRPT